MTQKAKGINRRLKIELTPALINRFNAAVDKAGPNDCWNWTRSFRNGYGAIKHQRRVLSAHRLAYVIAHGEPKDGLLVAHKCDNRACCNPAHLEAATAQKNNSDAAVRGAQRPCGEQLPQSKLNDQAVSRIWSQRRNGLGSRRIAKALGLNETAVKHVLSKQSWKHLVPSWAK